MLKLLKASLALCLAGLVVLGGAWPNRAQVETVTVERWAVPTPESAPAGIAFDPLTGVVFFTEANADQVGRLDPNFNTITEWAVGNGPNDAVFSGSNLYFTVSVDNRISGLFPGANGVASEAVPTGGSFPNALAVGTVRPGFTELWFTERLGNKLGRLTIQGFIFDALRPTVPAQSPVRPGLIRAPVSTTLVPPLVTEGNPGLAPAASFIPEEQSGAFSEWDLSALFPESSFPEAVAVAPDGRLWIGNSAQRTLVQFDPLTDTALVFELPLGSVAVGLALDGRGHVWFTQGVSNRIGRFDPHSQEVTEWALPGLGQPLNLALDPDGRVWFTDREGDRIGRIDPVTNTLTAYQLPEDAGPADLLLDASGALWFTAERGNWIGRIARHSR